jgi:hypothetical protein
MKNMLTTVFAALLLAAVPVALAQDTGTDTKKPAKATGKVTKSGDSTTISAEQLATLCVAKKDDQPERFGRWDEQNKSCTPLRLPKKPKGEYSLEEMISVSEGVTATDSSGTVHCDLCTTYCHGDLVCDPRCHYTSTYACGTHSCNCH